MPKEILINIESGEKRVAIVNNGVLEEFYIERPQDKTIVGNIYKGRIDAVLPALGAAFVDIGLLKKGFLYLSELEEMLEHESSSDEGPDEDKQVKKPQRSKKSPKETIKKNQEVMVQVVKEQFGTKGPRLSCNIGLAGRYLVLTPHQNHIGVSRRIEEDDERRRLKQVLHELKLPKDAGFIVRTAASGKSKQELDNDVHFLSKLWDKMSEGLEKRKAPAVVYEEYDLTLRVIRDSFADDVDKLVVDSKEEYYRIMRFMKTFLKYLSGRVHYYPQGNLFENNDIERQINRIHESKVYLKSKAYLVIEPTEGLVVIDVNSGGFKRNIEQEDMAFKVNCEAAQEVARQLKLRDLGGIIVIDFIDMEKEGHRREVFNVLKKALSTDKAKYDILGISRFGVVEMTRERVHRTIQMLSYQVCPYCQGRAKIKSALTVSIDAQRELKKYLQNNRVKEVSVSLNPVIVDEILKSKQGLYLIERKFHVKVNLISNPALHLEDIRVS